MSETTGTITVDCPSGEAATYLTEFFARLGTSGGEGAMLSLCVPLGDATLTREVIATITSPKASPGLRVMGISWVPKGGGPYPAFEGTLALNDRSGATSTLTIMGKYGPPGGVVGAAFDAVLGNRLADASLKALLTTLKTAVEAARTQTAAVAASYLPTYE